MKKTLIGLSIVMLLVSYPSFARAEESEVITPSVTQPGKMWRTEAQELREDIKQERETLMQENRRRMKRSSLKRTNRNGKNLERIQEPSLREKVEKNERSCEPTIVQQRKELIQANKTERRDLRTDIVTKMQTFRQTVATRWQNLWSSILGKNSYSISFRIRGNFI